jgi:Mrp family chromosome partitioning ATPase
MANNSKVEIVDLDISENSLLNMAFIAKSHEGVMYIIPQ